MFPRRNVLVEGCPLFTWQLSEAVARTPVCGVLLLTGAAVVVQDVREVREGLAFLLGTQRDLAQLRARRHCNYLADVVQAALLLEKAEREMLESGNARKVVIARLFVDAHLRAPHARGIMSNSRTALDLFFPLTRYGVIDPTQADAALRRA